MRIVSTTCSNTEIVCALGCADYLIAVDDHSDYPADVLSRLPRIGPDLTVNIDKIAALKPDLVLASLTVPGHEKVIAGLQQAGLRFLSPAPVCLDDVYADIRTIADALDVPQRAQPLIAAMQQRMPPHQPGQQIAAQPSLLVQWWPKPVIVPGKHSWVTDLLCAAGLRNPLADRPVKSQPLADKDVAMLNPDAIVIAWCGVQPEKYRPDVVYNNPAFANIKAIVNRQVHCIPEAYLGRPAPRLVEGYQAFRVIAGELTAVN